jgi:hypothetical protein
MAKLNVQLCPETGICSLIREDRTKIDMMPDEVAQLRQASGDTERSKAILAQIDAGFSQSLDDEELGQLSDEIK